MEFLQLCVGDARIEYGHASGVGPKLSDSIDRSAIIYAVIAGLTIATRVVPIRLCSIRYCGTAARVDATLVLGANENRRVIDMHVAIAGMRRSFKFRMANSQRIRRFLGFARRPMQRPEVDRKFRGNVAKRWPREKTVAVLRSLWVLENTQDIGALLAALTA